MTKPHIIAKVAWVPTAEGGRHSPIFSGYRDQFHLHGADDIADVEWLFAEASVSPGASTKCQAAFARPNTHLPRIHIGDHFEVREGTRIVGRGEIIELIDQDSV